MNFENISNVSKMNQFQSKNIFEDLKSDYFLQKVCNYITRKKVLDIMKYNKRLQKRIKLNINDYIQFSQLYSSIIIELNLVENNYDKFINITEKEKEYFHIYFDNSNEEIKRDHLEQNEKVKTIKVKINYQVESFFELFRNCKNINSIFFKQFTRINITNMSNMFYKCSLLKEIDFSNFITDNVNNMRSMFYECVSLKELNLSNFNTNNVIDMSSMFGMCLSLEELNLSNFNTNNVINMAQMFFECSYLKKINVSSFNTNKVTNMSCMFCGCKLLKELNISNFNTNNVIDMTSMFGGCISLKELAISNLNINNQCIIDYMFNRCSDELIKKINLQNKNSNIEGNNWLTNFCNCIII